MAQRPTDQLRIATQVADLIEAGDMHSALELLARYGDEAARAHARQALGGQTPTTSQ